MSVWPGKLAGSPRPEVQALGVAAAKVTKSATDLLNEKGKAETALDQFDLVTRAAFVDSVNGAVKIIFGQLSDIEHNPPSTAKGPIPPGFVDRFFMREGGSRSPTLKELDKSLGRAKEKVAQLEAQIKEQQEELATKLKEKNDKELKEKLDQAANAQKSFDDAAAELAKLKAEIAKLQTPPPPDDE